MKPHSTSFSQHAVAEPHALEARVAHRIVATLAMAELPADITERLRFARESAVSRRKQPAAGLAPAVVGTGNAAALLGPREGGGRWWQFASIVPLLVLLAGLFFIQQWHADRQIHDAADIDAALLTDDLPPEAYADPGFVEFLKSPAE